MNNELKNALLSFYTALLYPVSGVLALIGILLILEHEFKSKFIGVGLIGLAAASMFLFASLGKRKSDKPANVVRIAIGMSVIIAIYWLVNSTITKSAG